MKKVLTLVLSVVMVASISVQAMAKDEKVTLDNLDPSIITSLSTNQKKELKNDIVKLTDDEFAKFMHDKVSKSKNKIELRENLKEIGIEMAPITNKKKDNNEFKTMNDAYNATVIAYSYKRTGEAQQYLQASFTLGSYESRPASYDLVGMYFDSSKANYYSYSVDSGYTSLRSGSKATSGLVLFNFYDALVDDDYDVSHYCTVKITPTVSGQWIDYGVDISHTYNVFIYTTTGDASIEYNSVGLVTGSSGYSLTTTSKEDDWGLADTNAFYR